MSLDCYTEKGKRFISSQHKVEDLISQIFNVEVVTKNRDTEKYDADIFKNGILKAVCEIKTREFWSRLSGSWFTFEKMKSDRYMISHSKLKKLKEKSENHGIISCIFLHIPYEKKIVYIKTTDKKGNFLIDFYVKRTKTKKTCNDEKGYIWRDNAFIKYDSNIFKVFNY